MEKLLEGLKCAESTKEGIRHILRHVKHCAEYGFGMRTHTYPMEEWTGGPIHGFSQRCLKVMRDKIGVDKIDKWAESINEDVLVGIDVGYKDELVLRVENARLKNMTNHYSEMSIELEKLFDENNLDHMVAMVSLLTIAWEPSRGTQFLPIWNCIPEWKAATQNEHIISRAVCRWCSYRMDKLKKLGYVSKY